MIDADPPHELRYMFQPPAELCWLPCDAAAAPLVSAWGVRADLYCRPPGDRRSLAENLAMVGASLYVDHPACPWRQALSDAPPVLAERELAAALHDVLTPALGTVAAGGVALLPELPPAPAAPLDAEVQIRLREAVESTLDVLRLVLDRSAGQPAVPPWPAEQIAGWMVHGYREAVRRFPSRPGVHAASHAAVHRIAELEIEARPGDLLVATRQGVESRLVLRGPDAAA
jgi:hypothetical protein